MGREAFEHETEIEIDVVKESKEVGLGREALEHETDIIIDVIVASTVDNEDRNSENDSANKVDGE